MDIEFAEKLIRKVLPSYRVEEMIGRGSFGAVFRIKDELKERAAKIIQLSATPSIEKGEITSAGKKIERDFRHIVESYEKIECEEIVSVYDFYKVSTGENSRHETAYAIVVMEIYPSNLIDFLMDYFEKNRRPVTMEIARTLMEKLAYMLGNLYTKRGFLFEDLKPENLLVKTQNGDYKIVVGDIGGLKSVGSVAATGSQVTLSYCAAEVVRKGQKPTLRSIMYSYGLISYLVLEGHLPYERCGISDRIDLIRSRGLVFEREDIPENLKKVIEKCLAFEAEERYRDFDEIAAAIQGKEIAGGFGNETVDLDGFRVGNETIDLDTFKRIAPGQPVSNGGAPYYRSMETLENSVGITSSLSQRMITEKRRNETIRITDEKEAISRVDKEINGLVIKNGDVYKLLNESYKVFGEIRVHKGALLIMENAKLYFDENSGIVSQGTVRAKSSVFSAIDFSKKWKNIVICPSDTRINFFKDCKFRFGKGRTWKSMSHLLSGPANSLADGYLYGGAVFMAEVKEKVMSIGGCEFYGCSAQDGGGIYCLKSEPTIENCTFDNCTVGLSGGAVTLAESNAVLRNCRISNCSASKEGGGLFCLSSNPVIDGCYFDGCSTRYLYGGGIYCAKSNAIIRNCKFNRCSASKGGGGIYHDNKSSPKIMYPAFTNCRPSDTN